MIQHIIPHVFLLVQVNMLKLKLNFEKLMVRKLFYLELNFPYLFCSAQCRRELEEEGDMNEDEILRETANIR